MQLGAAADKWLNANSDDGGYFASAKCQWASTYLFIYRSITPAISPTRVVACILGVNSWCKVRARVMKIPRLSRVACRSSAIQFAISWLRLSCRLVCRNRSSEESRSSIMADRCSRSIDHPTEYNIAICSARRNIILDNALTARQR